MKLAIMVKQNEYGNNDVEQKEYDKKNTRE